MPYENKSKEKFSSGTGRQVLMNTYAQTPMALVKGEGCRVWDQEGRVYLDFLGGIAVTALGHSHPRVVGGHPGTGRNRSCTPRTFITSNRRSPWPNNWSIIPLPKRSFSATAAPRPTKRPSSWSGAMRPNVYGPEKRTILCMENSFHGRTMGSLSATGQNKFQQGFEPLLPGFAFAPFDDLAALDRAWDDSVCAVLLEPVQGEGGVRVPDPDFLKGGQETLSGSGRPCLILDEVQTGLGRTGTLFAHEQFGLDPDLMTLAKALGNGLPIGALLATDEVAAGLQPGSPCGHLRRKSPGYGRSRNVLGDPPGTGISWGGSDRQGRYFQKTGCSRWPRNTPQVHEARGRGLLWDWSLDRAGETGGGRLSGKGFPDQLHPGYDPALRAALDREPEEIDQLVDYAAGSFSRKHWIGLNDEKRFYPTVGS